MYPFSLKHLNTMQIDVSAKNYRAITDANSLKDIDWSAIGPFHILGGGSNTLFTRDYSGTIIHLQNRGRDVLEEKGQTVLLHVASGEDWTELVNWVVDQGWGGIENLSLIPGSAGAAPVQNIAAYGQNLSDVLDYVECFDTQVGKQVVITGNYCHFGYRTSLFKKVGNRFIITGVVLKLTNHPTPNTSYFSIGKRSDSIVKELAAMQCQPPFTIKAIAQAVTNIRRRKLPDIATVPSVGSFFKNPLVSREKLHQLQNQIENLQYYPPDQLRYVNLSPKELSLLKQVKVPVGRLIDSRGWVGRHVGHCHIYRDWASIITHDGHATGQEVHDFSQLIAQDIADAYDITLETEVTIM
jgi:UDP-N-acetylmuramate dehydrogenase